MCKVLIFGGTTEGRLLYAYCVEHRIPAVVCVATRYGEQVLQRERQKWNADEAVRFVSVRKGRLGLEEMRETIRREGAGLVLDATHPYALEATDNIRAACEAEQVPCERIVREGAGEEDEALSFETIGEAVAFLGEKEGNIFAATGGKELALYTALPDYRDRLYVRILPRPEGMAECISLGIEGRHLTAMQGPFSEEMNYAFLKEFQIRWMVTKQSGSFGGFMEKQRAAKRAGVNLIVIRRRSGETGISLEEAMRYLEEWK